MSTTRTSAASESSRSNETSLTHKSDVGRSACGPHHAQGRLLRPRRPTRHRQDVPRPTGRQTRLPLQHPRGTCGSPSSNPTKPQRRLLVQHFTRLLKAAGIDEDTLVTDGMSPADIRSIVESVAYVGPDVLDAEVARIRVQRAAYQGKKVSDFFRVRKKE